MPYVKRTPGTMVSSSAPAETNVIWIDNSSGNNVPKIYDTVRDRWMPINSGSAEQPQDTELRDQLAQLRLNIQQDIDALTKELNNMDNQSELDNLKIILNNLMNDMGENIQNYYTIEQSNAIIQALSTLTYVDTQLSKKVNIGDTYTKEQEDFLLESKVDKASMVSELQRKADLEDIYTKNETRLLIQSYVDADEPNYEPIDMSMYLTKSQGSDLFMSKTDLSIYATNQNLIKSIDDLRISLEEEIETLSGSIDLSKYYLKGETFSQSEIEAKLMLVAKKSEINDMFSGYAKIGASFSKVEAETKFISKEALADYATAKQLSEGLSGKADAVLVYSKTETDSKYLAKSELNSINHLIGLKANIEDIYTKNELFNKTEVNTLVNTKADKTEFSNYLTANQVEDRLKTKLNIDDFNLEIDKKANKSNVYSKTEIDAKFANKVDNSVLNSYYLATAIDSKLGLKADTSSVYTQTESDTKYTLKQDFNSLVTTVGQKANSVDVFSKTEINSALANKADKTALNSYFTSTEVTSKLNLKADASSVYTQTQVTALLANKSDVGHTHTNLHSPYVIGTKTINESKISDKRILAFNGATGQLEYASIRFDNLLGIGTIVFSFA